MAHTRGWVGGAQVLGVWGGGRGDKRVEGRGGRSSYLTWTTVSMYVCSGRGTEPHDTEHSVLRRSLGGWTKEMETLLMSLAMRTFMRPDMRKSKSRMIIEKVM